MESWRCTPAGQHLELQLRRVESAAEPAGCRMEATAAALHPTTSPSTMPVEASCRSSPVRSGASYARESCGIGRVEQHGSR